MITAKIATLVGYCNAEAWRYRDQLAGITNVHNPGDSTECSSGFAYNDFETPARAPLMLRVALIFISTVPWRRNCRARQSPLPNREIERLDQLIQSSRAFTSWFPLATKRTAERFTGCFAMGMQASIYASFHWQTR
jgi:hypothetical protein